MTFLPIVERELRVAARRWGTYWTRLGLALAATILGAGMIEVTAAVGLPPVETGKYLFRGLAGVVILYCLAYGRRATADCLSMEKREGTLGLLFLTDLKGYDIVLGKLAGTSVGGLYALLGVLPVLSLCLLLGGTSSGEFWRIVLVLLNTFFLSLAVGMFGSALTRDFRRAMGANFMLLLLFIAAIPAVHVGLVFLFGQVPAPTIVLISPIYAFPLSFDSEYVKNPLGFWQCIAGIHLEAWLLIVLASRLLPRSRQEGTIHSKRARWREFWHAWSYGKAAHRPAFRKRLLNINAFYWLAARARLKPLHVWVLLASVAFYWTVGRFFEGQYWGEEESFVVIALMLNFALKTWIAIEAGYELADDQKSGAIELLLSAPLTPKDILTGQVLALRRQFLKPCLAAIATTLVLMILVYRQHPGEWAVPVVWLAAIVMFILDVVALVGLAMFRALTAKNHNVAIVTTLLRLLILPWAVFGLVIAAALVWYGLAGGRDWSPGWQFYLWLWFGLGVAADLIFGGTAWVQLLNNFRPLALRRYDRPRSRLARWLERKPPLAALPAAPPVPSEAKPLMKEPPHRRRRRLGAAFAIFAVLAVAGIWTRQSSQTTFPPAVVVPVMLTGAHVQVFPTHSGALIILPDRSLWRWGQTDGVSGSAQVPEKIGTNYDWVEAASDGAHCAGLRADGSLWEWGRIGSQTCSEPEPAPLEGDWEKIGLAPFGETLLRRGGTLWHRTYTSSNHNRPYVPQRNDGSAPATNLPSRFVRDPYYAMGVTITNLVQLGGDQDWIDFSWSGSATLGLKRDGSLWSWTASAQVPGWPASTNSLSTFNHLRVDSGTNWASLAMGLGPMAWTRSGELWDFSPWLRFSSLSAKLSGRLVLSNSAPGRAALAITDLPKLFMLRADGSLWADAYSIAPGSATKGNWQRVGRRSDWVSLWGNGWIAFGLTGDGTLWTWGLDPTHPPARPSFALRMRAIKWGLQNLRGARRSQANFPFSPAYVKEPRPLMRLVPTNAP